MKSIASIFITVILFIQCSAQNHTNKWKVVKVKSSYVQKGILDDDYYRPPKSLIKKKVQIKDSLLILTGIRREYQRLESSNAFGDTLIIEKRVSLISSRDDESSVLYPGDEFIECIKTKADTCLIGKTFLNLLEFNCEVINAYPLSSRKQRKVEGILFVLKEDNEIVLFIENEFLLLFLNRITSAIP
jgi:hypothetical protein